MSELETYWWCKKDIRQTREHLFKEWAYWKEDIKMLWEKVVWDIILKWKTYYWILISELFNEDKDIQASLWF
jgi:hypothetical protein